MANILDLLNSDLGKQIIGGISSQTNTSTKDTKSVLTSALPAMLGGLHKNAAEGNGDGILNALNSHDGSILNNITDFIGGGSKVSQDGNSILGHIFGNKVDAVNSGISKQSGVAKDKVSSIIALAAPILMGYLGKEKSNSKVNDNSGLSGMLGGLLGGSGGNILSSLLDQDGDGKLGLNDIASVLSGNNKKSGGLLGGLLGGLFGGK